MEAQIEALAGRDEEAVTLLRTIIRDERAHHDASLDHLGGSKVWRALIEPIVAVSTEAVIWLGMRL